MFPDKQPLHTYTHQLRSRYGETDKMGYVYYGRYLEYFEVARTEMIRHLGLPYTELEKRGIMLPVIQTHIDYKAPIYYDELMEINVYLFDIPAVKLETWYKIFTGRREEPHALGWVNLCFMEEETRKPCRAPQHFIQRLNVITDESR
ncbi:MAG: thioesterase family protein [Balneolaceae bacterium]|nr:thioesterase family protein [Balneolaceae bacterium]